RGHTALPSGTTRVTPSTVPRSTHGGSPSRTEPRSRDRRRSRTARRRSGIQTSGPLPLRRRPKEPRGGSGRPSVHSFRGVGRTFGPPIEDATHLPIPLVRDALLGRFAFSGSLLKGPALPASFKSKRAGLPARLLYIRTRGHTGETGFPPWYQAAATVTSCRPYRASLRLRRRGSSPAARRRLPRW